MIGWNICLNEMTKHTLCQDKLAIRKLIRANDFALEKSNSLTGISRVFFIALRKGLRMNMASNRLTLFDISKSNPKKYQMRITQNFT